MHMRLLIVPSLAVLLAGCGEHADKHAPGAHAADDGHGHDAAIPAAGAETGHEGHNHGQGGITLPDTVQKNLGITWATAEYRVVQGVVRMPGRFEAEPTARRPYQTPLDGRVEVLVKPYQQVEAGAVLYRLHSAAWQRLQQEIADAVGAVKAAADNLAAAEEHAAAITQALTLWSERLATLDRLGKDLGGKAAERADAAGRVADLRISAAKPSVPWPRRSARRGARMARCIPAKPRSGLICCWDRRRNSQA
jgi:multidrug efflux pump subunit AcrA (membrane-fusion protein)